MAFYGIRKRARAELIFTRSNLRSYYVSLRNESFQFLFLIYNTVFIDLFVYVFILFNKYGITHNCSTTEGGNRSKG